VVNGPFRKLVKGEERRRTNVIPRFFDEKGALKLAFVALWRASERWRGVWNS